MFMVVRRESKSRKLRGRKTHGYGSKKKHRGAGSRGGKGQSGMLKHKKSFMLKYEPQHFGKIGFHVPPAAKRIENAINLKRIDILAKKLNKTEINLSEFGYQKVLSTGDLTQPLTIKAEKFVEKAKEKILNAGGKVIESV